MSSEQYDQLFGLLVLVTFAGLTASGLCLLVALPVGNPTHRPVHVVQRFRVGVTGLGMVIGLGLGLLVPIRFGFAPVVHVLVIQQSLGDGLFGWAIAVLYGLLLLMPVLGGFVLRHVARRQACR